jgi:uncharacterized Zn-binding protein involved in type VI secretion
MDVDVIGETKMKIGKLGYDDVVQPVALEISMSDSQSQYLLATVGSSTALGGHVVTGQKGMYIDQHLIAAVGDTVRYPHGRESAITSGAGEASVICGKPAAIVGSHIGNGDRITATLQQTVFIIEYGVPTLGLLQPYFVPTSPNR